MIRLHYSNGPNPKKVALFLEEAGLPYEAVPVDTRKGEQHAPAFRRLNPNGKTPALEDGDTTVFDSNAILLYLGDKTGQFMHADKAALYSWLMFVATGMGPYFGQSVHFGRMAPEKPPYAVNRFRREAERHFQVLNDQIGDHPFILGERYTIVDMAAWGWSIMNHMVLEDGDKIAAFPNVKRWLDSISARPAAQRALALGKDVAFKTEMDADAQRHLFPSNH